MITLVLGGVRSGKSEVAERLAGPGPGTYLATGLVASGDDDFAGRVARHRARRPAAWATVEEPRAVPEVLGRLQGPVLLDALGTWIANDPRADIDGLVEALVGRTGDTVVVSEEVGLGVHPVSEVGRQFADRLGEANRRVAEVADRCLLVVAGRVIDLPPGCDRGGPGWPGRPEPDVPTADRPGASIPEAGSPAGPVAPEGRSRPSTSAGRDRSRSEPARPAAGGGFRQAVGFLTPVGGAAAPTPEAFVWFPVVGALIGLALGALWWAVDDRLGPLAAAALVVAADLAVTGALHFDGLLDSADGLLPHLPPERRLAVMAEPDVGAFAVAAGGSALLLRTTVLAAFGAARPWLLAALWSAARTAMAVTALTGHYARPGGLASSFLTAADRPAADRPALTSPAETSPASPPPEPTASPVARAWRVAAAPGAVGVVVAIGMAAVDDPRSVVAVVAAALGAAGVAALAGRRVGGFTGDTLGAGGVVAETVGLLAALAVVHP